MMVTDADARIKLPPFAFHDYTVDVQLRIRREIIRYSLDILAMGSCQTATIEMRPLDLVVLNMQLKEAMEAIASENMEDQELTSREAQERLHRLALVGNFAYKRVFSDDGALATIQKLFSLRSAILVEITSEDFFLPWELLYPLSPDESLSYEHFWGMNHIISRIIAQPRPGAFAPPVIGVAQRPKVGLCVYGGLPSVVAREMPFLEKLHRDGKIVLFKLRALDPEKKWDELKAFRNFWYNALDLAHFACHAFYKDESPDSSYILLSDEFPITLMDMEVYSLSISGHPLIIMNACETGNLNPLYTSHFASAFLRYGARGVVATECAVPDAFAADFVEQLYAHLLAGKPLGEGLLATRRYFLEKHHNPSGLLYSMYAPPSIRLVNV